MDRDMSISVSSLSDRARSTVKALERHGNEPVTSFRRGNTAQFVEKQIRKESSLRWFWTVCYFLFSSLDLRTHKEIDRSIQKYDPFCERVALRKQSMASRLQERADVLLFPAVCNCISPSIDAGQPCSASLLKSLGKRCLPAFPTRNQRKGSLRVGRRYL